MQTQLESEPVRRHQKNGGSRFILCKRNGRCLKECQPLGWQACHRKRCCRHAAQQRRNADAVEAHLPCTLCLAGITDLLQVTASSSCGNGSLLTGSLQRNLAGFLAHNGQPTHRSQLAARLPWQGIDEAIIHQLVLQGQW